MIPGTEDDEAKPKAGPKKSKGKLSVVVVLQPEHAGSSESLEEEMEMEVVEGEMSARPSCCSCSCCRLKTMVKIVVYTDIIICLAGLVVAIYFLDVKAKSAKIGQMDAYLLLTASCGIQMTYSLLGLLVNIVFLVPLLTRNKWTSRSMRVLGLMVYAGFREFLMLVQMILLLFKYTDLKTGISVICSVFAFLLILYGVFFTLFVAYRIEVDAKRKEQETLAVYDEMDPDRERSKSQSTMTSSNSRFHRPSTPRITHRPSTPRIAHRPSTPRIAHRTSTPRVAHRPSTPRIANKKR